MTYQEKYAAFTRAAEALDENSATYAEDYLAISKMFRELCEMKDELSKQDNIFLGLQMVEGI